MRPNILLMIADQHRWDAVGSAGRFNIQTPHIDRLAREGVFFENAYTPCPVCAPARQALLTGLAPESFGALWNHDFIPTPTAAPKEEYWTAGLSRAGYRCGLVGKWNSSMTHSPASFGFEDAIDFADYQAMVSDKYSGLSYRNRWFGEASPVRLEDSKTHWIAAQACSLMDRYESSGSPWLIRVDFTDPHLPCRPSAPFSSMYAPDALEPWDSFGDSLENKPYIQRQQLGNWGLESLGWEDWKACVSFYYGMVSQVDDAAGIMLKKLDDLGLAGDTLVIYTSDHGDLCGGHGMLDKHYVLYDDVTHVPLVIRLPGSAGGGARAGEFVSNCLDMGATIRDLCGLEGVVAGHGRSLAPLLQGVRQPDRDFAVSSSNGQQFGLYTQRSIRTADWLYVWNMTDIDELYDIHADPGQKTNRIGDSGLEAAVSELRKRLHAELLRREDPFVARGWLDGQLLEGRKLLR